MARSHGLKTKTLRRMLKKKGMKTTGKKATLMKRLHLKGGNARSDALTAANAMPETTKEEAEARCAAQKAAFELPEEEAKGDPMEVDAMPVQGGRRRRRSRRREEGGRRRGRKSRRGAEMLGY